MNKKIKVFLMFFTLLIIYVYCASITLMPDSITLIQGEKLNLFKLWGISVEENDNSNPNINNYKLNRTVEASNLEENELKEVGKINLSINIFKNLALKNVTVNVIPKTTVVPLGNAIGLKLYTQGVLVVGMSEIEGKKPYENTGIVEGDRIIEVNNIALNTTQDLIDNVNKSNGKEVELKYISLENEEKVVNMLPVKTKENDYKLGLWVRDAAAGVGTLTFYESETGMFASLGHGVTDIDTGNLITIANGELVTSNIIGIVKGEKGKPGEIRGSIEGAKKIGIITKNTNFGIFGKIQNKNSLKINQNEMEVLARNEIRTGNAQIICEIENGKKKYYDIEIQKIYTANNNNNKSMLIKVTDKELLKKTGGIVQGMSGSPIIQDGKFVGAVTHVLVSDPTTGYRSFC